MIETDDFYEDIVRIFLSVDRLHGFADDRRAVAQTAEFDFGISVQCFTDHTGRIGKVDQIGVWLGNSFHRMSDLDHRSDRLEAHDHAARCCRFLADQTVFERDRFIQISSIGHTRTDRRHDEVRILYSGFIIRMECDDSFHPGIFEHLFDIFARTVETVFIDVHQTPFSDLHRISSFNQHFRNVR